MTLQQQLRPHMQHMVPLPSIYSPDFIAANQEERAANILLGESKMQHLEQVAPEWVAASSRAKVDVPELSGTRPSKSLGEERSHRASSSVSFQ